MKIQLSPIKKFMLLYVVYITLFFILIEHKYFQSLIDINGLFSNSVTYFSANILELFVPLTYDRYFIHLPNGSLEVLFGCSGLESVLLYLSAILAYPAFNKERLYGFIIGFIVINIINIVRIVALGYVFVYHHSIFDITHDYITQNIMIVFVFLVFVVYLNWIGDKDETKA